MHPATRKSNEARAPMTERRFDPRRWLMLLIEPLDPALLLILSLLLSYAFVLMVSASPERMESQMINSAVAISVMWVAARMPSQRILALALPVYVTGVLLLVAVALFGEISKGAQRWLDIGVARIQPSELMKVAAPLMLAWYFQQREGMIRVREFLVAGALLLLPVGLIVKQPDLGTALLVAAAGFYVLFFAGLSWKLILPVAVVAIVGIGSIVGFGDRICQPDVDWVVLHGYQKNRVYPARSEPGPVGQGFSSSSPPSRSARAASSERAGRPARRPTCPSFQSGIPISSSRCSARSSVSPGRWSCWRFTCCSFCAVARSQRRRRRWPPACSRAPSQ